MTKEISNNTKNRGRPKGTGIYNEECCDKAYTLLCQGKLDVHICSELGINRKTFYEWIKTHPEFEKAIESGDIECHKWWYDRMQQKFEAGDDHGYRYCQIILANHGKRWGYGDTNKPTGTTNNTQINVNNLNLLNSDKSNQELLEVLKNTIQKIPQSVIPQEIIDIKLIEDDNTE